MPQEAVPQYRTRHRPTERVESRPYAGQFSKAGRTEPVVLTGLDATLTARETTGGARARTRTQPALPMRLRPQDQTLLRPGPRAVRGPARPRSRRPTRPASSTR